MVIGGGGLASQGWGGGGGGASSINAGTANQIIAGGGGGSAEGSGGGGGGNGGSPNGANGVNGGGQGGQGGASGIGGAGGILGGGGTSNGGAGGNGNGGVGGGGALGGYGSGLGVGGSNSGWSGFGGGGYGGGGGGGNSSSSDGGGGGGGSIGPAGSTYSVGTNANSGNGSIQISYVPISTLNITTPLGSLTSCLGTESTPTTFGVSGSGLTASVTISAPSNFEISTSSGGTYSSSFTLTNSSTVSQTLYVRLNSLATVGSKTGTITATSTGASDVTTTISGTVNALQNISISGSTTNVDLVSLTASGGITYAWSDGSSTSSATNTFDASGLYSISVTDANGCISSTLLNITVQHWGLSRTGEKTLDSASQINANGQIASLNPISASGKISIYKIYNNGLVLNLDASNASSYSGNGNIWYDLSGNNINATFGTSSPTYSNLNGGIFNFDGTQDMTLALDDLPYGNTRFTLNAWAKATVTNLACNLIIAYGNATYDQTRFLGSCDGKFQFGGFGGGVHDVQSSIDFPLNTWVNMTGTYDGSTAILYVNGVEISRKSINNWNTVKQSGYIGKQVGGLTQRWNGSISNVQLYNRVLLPSEILANYNALKSRFGL